jgi:feruloyl esterase
MERHAVHRVITAWVLALALVMGMSPAFAADAHSDAVARCNAMRGADLSDQPETPAHVIEAVIIKATEDVPEACVLDGTIAAAIGFKVALPLQGWNGKYFQGGCGGACGTTRLFWCDEPLRRGYACASTDMGHRSSTADWSWAGNDIQRKADFGYRATHLTALVGKALTARYFGKQPERAYFFGCSTGGRQGLIEAQDFPWDFDGIVAGAAPLDETGTALQLAWTVQANVDAQGKAMLDEASVRLLHAAVVAACDMNDGVADEVIGDPRKCHFDIEQLRCKSHASSSCLSAAQVGAARKIYSGPVDSKGLAIGHTGGAMLGSELYWLGDYVYGQGREPQYLPFIESFMRYMAFDPAPGPRWKLSDLNVQQDVQRLGINEKLFNASNPDLRRFKAAGRKMIGFQGWGDTSVVPMQYVDYYETVTRTMGGAKATQDFYRFFTVPGMRHCSSDGAGGDTIDYLTALEQWVEQGKAPEALLGANFDWQGMATRAPVFPLPAARVRFTRPAFMYPATPVYQGKGDTRLAENFQPSKPEK